MATPSSFNGSKSLFSQSSKKSVESALIAAATKRAEMEARKTALQQRLKLEAEEYKLKETIQKQEEAIKFRMMELEQQRQMLEVQTEIEVENAKIAALEEYGSDAGSLGASLEDAKESRSMVQGWLDINNGANDTAVGPMVTKQEIKAEIHQPPHGNQEGENIMLPANTLPSNLPPMSNTLIYDDQYHGPNHGLLTKPTDITDNTHMVTKMLLEQHVRSSLPKRTLQPFTNDPLQFTAFIRNFEYTIEGKGTSERDCLLFLEQFTRGEANGLVRSCLQMEDGRGYKEAKKLLQKRFGNVHRIAESYLSKMRAWPTVKNDDAAGLQDLSLFLLECKNTMESLEYTSELYSTANIRLLLEKLPYKMRDRWRQRADYIEEDVGRPIKFDDFSIFVEKQARIQNNAAFGKIGGDKSGTGTSHQGYSKGTYSKPKMKTSFATNVEESPSNKQLRCSYCELENHTVETCFKLERLTIEERLKHLKHIGVCFGCLKKASHRSKDCKKKLVCRKCSKNHPTVLHLDKPASETTHVDNKHNTNDRKEERVTNAGICHCHHTGAGDNASPCIIPVKVRSKSTGIMVETFAYLDSGSDATFCTTTLSQQLNLKGRPTKLDIQTMTGNRKLNSTILQGLEICDMDMKNSVTLPKVYTQEEIPASRDHVVTQEQISNWPHLEKVCLHRLEDDANAHIGMLIGNNVPQLFEPWEVVHSSDGGPYACKTLLGWTVYGMNNKSSLPLTITRTRVEENLDDQLVQLYNQDFTERIIDDKPEKSIQDKQFLMDVNNTIRFSDGHYEVGLPFKNETVQLPNNKGQALQRIGHLRARFKRNQDFYEDYNTFMNDTISKNYATKIPVEELDGPQGRTWYIPHHGVYHPRKHKLRVVFDCGASFKGQSLNKELNQGPDLTNTLVGVITRFRQDYVAIMADIEGMFQQVKVPPRDRDLQRFLWWPNGDLAKPLEEYRMGVHIFGATSSPACANYALHRAAEDGRSMYDQQVINTIYNNFYMDDCLKSVATEEEAVKLASDLRKICSDGGFKLTKWVSNSRTVLQSLPVEERAKEVKGLDLDRDNLPSERALGILWSANTDTFGFKISIKDRPATRRGILSVVSSIYDPLGFITPATLPIKEILQDLCRHRMGWDDEIPLKHRNKWRQWLAELPKLENLSVSRCYKPPNFGEIKTTQLHHFSDASMSGYGTVSYLRMVNSNGDIHCAFVMGKARVAPLKQITIPRLELTAATIAVKVNSMITKQLDVQVDDTIFWTDSYTVLRYICNVSTRFHTFVANRIGSYKRRITPVKLEIC